MYHNINSGRLRQFVEIYLPSVEPDDFGQVEDSTLVFDAWAECKTISGAKIQSYGTTTTSTIITVLMWYDERASNDQILKWDGVEYDVNHVNHDPLQKAMILTCEVIKK